jgi:hypothetical protein
MIKPTTNNEKVHVVDPEGNDHWLNLTEYTLLRAEICRQKESGWLVWINVDDSGLAGLFRIDTEGQHDFSDRLFNVFDDALFYLGFGRNDAFD